MRSAIDDVLRDLAELVRQGRFEELESDTLEIKPAPAEGGQWRERYKSVNAFLNTRGGILILGIKEEGQGPLRRYVLTGYQDHAENKIKEMVGMFTDKEKRKLTLTENFPPPEIRPFLDKRVALVFVDELLADKKYCFYDGDAYKRVLTGDHRLTDQEIEAQEEFKQEMWQARELQPVEGATLSSLDLDRLNEYIQLLNRTVKIETVKASLKAARTFLERKRFIVEGSVTTLGMLVCGRYPGDHLGFRSQLHGFVEMPGVVAQDKQDFTDNVLPLMEDGFAYLLRNIQVGVSVSGGGSERPQYPEELLRETVNNALAHRDYSINRQVTLSIKPGSHICIQNPGVFRGSLLIDRRNERPQVLRIIPEPRPRNPRLADVLRVYRKWEGKGIGMATLVNLCLANIIGLPYYRLRQDEVALFICAGRLLDTAMERLLASFDGYILRKNDDRELSATQKLVLAYLIKSELANEQERHTILLTADNNHYQELTSLESRGLIFRHPQSPGNYPIYLADREFMRQNYSAELRALFGDGFTSIGAFYRECLNTLYRNQHFSRVRASSAKQIALFMWPQQGGRDDEIREFDIFYRKVRYTFNRLQKSGYILKKDGSAGYLLNEDYAQDRLL